MAPGPQPGPTGAFGRWLLPGCQAPGPAVDDRLQGRDDAPQVGLDLALVLSQAELALGVGLSDQPPVGGGLAPVGLQELRRGLEIRARKTSTGVRAFLLRRAGAITIREAVAHRFRFCFTHSALAVGLSGSYPDSRRR